MRKPHVRPPRGLLCLAPAVLLGLLAGCAGYQIGNQSLYPNHIRTVYVPVFESTSFRRNLGEWLTEAVQKEIERITPYKVVHTPDADSILTGRIIGETKRVVVEAESGDPRELQTALNVEITWVQRDGQVIRQPQTIRLPQAMTTVSGSGNLVPELGHSVATAHQESVREIARQIVGLMEAPW